MILYLKVKNYFSECGCLQTTAPTGEPLVAKCDPLGGCYCTAFKNGTPSYDEGKGCKIKGIVGLNK